MITVDFNRLHLRPGDRILDLGCGSGRHVRHAGDRDNVTVIGVDVNFPQLKTLHRELTQDRACPPRKNRAWGIGAADAACLPFKSGSFDLVICSEVLEHIDAHETVMAEIHRVLKKNRDLVVSVPSFFPEFICWGCQRPTAIPRGATSASTGTGESPGFSQGTGSGYGANPTPTACIPPIGG